MSKRLIIEVEMLNDKGEDAVFAPLFLAQRIAEEGIDTIWDREQTEKYDAYRIVWRLARENGIPNWIQGPKSAPLNTTEQTG